MKTITDHPLITTVCVIIVLIVVFAMSQFLYIRFNGSNVPAPEIPREPQLYGEGSVLTYVVLGDSTSIGQGGAYDESMAVGTARHLADSRQVEMYNYGVSGAVIRDLVKEQLPQVDVVPDVVLIAVGANNVTHLTKLSDMQRDAIILIDALRAKNPDVAIVFTGSPQMGSVHRLPQPTRWLAGQRTAEVNKMFDKMAAEKSIIRAPLAEETGEIFATTPSLFAADNFHPTGEGYDIWTPVVNDALDRALQAN